MTARRLDWLITVAIVTIVVGSAGFAGVRGLGSGQRRRGPRAPERVKDWRAYTTGGHRIGPANAKVIVTVFSDFQCPFCRRAFGALNGVQARHPGEVALLFRQFPLVRMHPHAYAAALASECAAAAGRFEAYQKTLFEHQRALAREPWTDLAIRAGISDTAAFARCVSDSTYAAVVRSDMEAGRRLAVRATPTVLVNSWRLREPPTLDVLDSLVAAELGATPVP